MERDEADYIGGCGYGTTPCANCESDPRDGDSPFCSDDCRDEFEGVGAYAED